MNLKELAALRRGITPKLREFILAEDCRYCGFPAAEVDHTVPVSRGGGMALANLAPACAECNAEKSDRTVDEWAAARLAVGEPWPIPSLTQRVADYIDRHGLTPEKIGDDACAWIVSLPGGYLELRRELVAARNRGGGAPNPPTDSPPGQSPARKTGGTTSPSKCRKTAASDLGGGA